MLDITAMGRQDGDGRSGVTKFLHHDKYDTEKKGIQYKD